MDRRLRMGMVGGGPGSFIGQIHRMAARLDGQIELTAGCFSTSQEKNRAAAKAEFLPPDRVYDDYRQMFERERLLPEEKRIDFVAIVTPNDTHFPIAMAALEAGFHVVCDKPMTLTVEDAETLQRRVEKTGLLFCLTHNYTGYPMVKAARKLIRDGELGEIRKVLVEYPQGWLAAPVTAANKQGVWRTDPAQTGVSCCMGDIGSHAENLVEYVTGLRITELLADLNCFVPGRTVDDDGSVLLTFDNGAKGTLIASQIAVGEENAFALRVYGTRASLHWAQETPETLTVRSNDGPIRLLRRNWAGIGADGSRIPAGHPEGFIEAFANLYREFAGALSRRLEGETDATGDFPTAADGVRGVKFIHAAVRSHSSGQKVQLD